MNNTKQTSRKLTESEIKRYMKAQNPYLDKKSLAWIEKSIRQATFQIQK